ncbi:MAG: hypothetical protein SVX38_15940, partial [Chloroflexota bacterium]|nr:hypothetical protein [Chloroflexota bacterium]
MGFFQKLASLFSPSGSRGDGNVLWMYVRCDRCGEVIRTRLHLANEPSATSYDERGQPTGFVLRKTLIGSRRCYQPIEVTLTLDSGRRIVER